ncbi:kelch repeat-containing protein, partial [Myxococcota bacterium]
VNVLQDIWEWDGASGTWTDVTPTGPKPTARAFHATAYDSGRGKLVLFGGSGGGTLLQDTWEWDGAWKNVTRVGTKPSARMEFALAFDNARSKLVLFGGGQFRGRRRQPAPERHVGVGWREQHLD